jgi:pimeloyl-ACP methyl ester carboxylesterase
MPFYLGHYAAFLARIRCPTLLVEGAESKMRFTAPESERRAGLIGPACRVSIPDAGHMLHVEAPGAVARAIASFLSDHGL